MTVINSFTGEHAFLSNFHESPIRQRIYDPNTEEQFSTVTFPTVENYFQAQKSHDALYRLQVCGVTPGMSKRLGRAVEIRADWEEVKLSVMRAGLGVKFPALNDKSSPNVHLTERLLETGDAYLVEGNTWGDRLWGKVEGTGDNWLGVLLMARRDELRHYASL